MNNKRTQQNNYKVKYIAKPHQTPNNNYNPQYQQQANANKQITENTSHQAINTNYKTKYQQQKVKNKQITENDSQIISDELQSLYTEQQGLLSLRNQIRRSLSSLLLSTSASSTSYPSKSFTHNFITKCLELILQKITIEETLATERAIERVQSVIQTVVPDDQRREIQESVRREIVREWNSRRVQEVQEIVKDLYGQMQRDDKEQGIAKEEQEWEAKLENQKKLEEQQRQLQQQEQAYDQKLNSLKQKKQAIIEKKLKLQLQSQQTPTLPHIHSPPSPKALNTIKQIFKSLTPTSFLETSFVTNIPQLCLTQFFKLQFLNYKCYDGQNCSDWNYFRAKELAREFLEQEPVVEYYQGDVVGIIRVIYPGIITTITLYRDFIDLGIMELETEIDGSQFESQEALSKEIIMSLNSSEIINNKQFIIDKNGFFKNILKYQYPDDKNHTIPVNYHPTSYIGIEDQNTKISMNLFMEHPIGVSSQTDGQLEVMLKRIFGKDNTVTKFRGFLGFYQNNNFIRKDEEITEILNSASLQFYAKTEKPLFEETKKQKPSSLINFQSYISVQFRLYSKDKILFQIINLNSNYAIKLLLFDRSNNTVENIFSQITGKKIKCKNIVETTLSGNEKISEEEKKKLGWRNANFAKEHSFLFAEKITQNNAQASQGTIILKPLDVRVFLFEFEE